jgi:hypothetical protein
MAQPAKEIHGGIEMVQEERVDDDWNVSFLPALNPMDLGGGFTPLAQWGWPVAMATPIFFFFFEKIYILIF